MNYDQFTLKTQEALQTASSLAQQNDHSEICPEHLLKALLEQKDGLVKPVIERIGVNTSELSAELNKIMVGMTGFEPATPWSQTRCATSCATSR